MTGTQDTVPESFAFEIEVGGSAPALARRRVKEALDGRVESGALEQLELLVSELVTNVVRHARSGPGDCLSLELQLRDDDVRVEVADCVGRPFDATPSPDPEKGRGYGLFLVEHLSRRWGVKRNGGTRVWFELGVAA
jgi:anti-sigma regulatory factor (Ser/Thr protein kinase)